MSKNIKDYKKKSRGITLIALIVTIIVLIILAGIAISMLTGDNNILRNSTEAREETRKSTAMEIMTLKITGIEMQSYAEKQRMPTLNEVADLLETDGDIKSVKRVQETASIAEYNSETSLKSIITVLNEYPSYEFEINSKLRLAKINGEKIAETDANTITLTEEELNTRINTAVQKAIEQSTTISNLNTTVSNLSTTVSELDELSDLDTTVSDLDTRITALEGNSGHSVTVVNAYSASGFTENINLSYNITDYDFILLQGTDGGGGISSSIYKVSNLSFNDSKFGIGVWNDVYSCWYKITSANKLTYLGGADGEYITKVTLIKI